MQTRDDILATAVVGTEQRELKLVARDDDLGHLLGQINNTDRESSLLSAAAVLALLMPERIDQGGHCLGRLARPVQAEQLEARFLIPLRFGHQEPPPPETWPASADVTTG